MFFVSHRLKNSCILPTLQEEAKNCQWNFHLSLSLFTTLSPNSWWYCAIRHPKKELVLFSQWFSILEKVISHIFWKKYMKQTINKPIFQDKNYFKMHTDEGKTVIIILTRVKVQNDTPNKPVEIHWQVTTLRSLRSAPHSRQEDLRQRRWVVDTNEAEGSRRSWQPWALLGLHVCIYKEISCASRLVLIKRTPTRKGLYKIHWWRLL